jgi:transposase
MGFREVSVVEVREVLRAWLEGAGLRMVAERAGVDRKTARRYVEAAQAAGLVRDAGVPVDEAVTDELIGLVVEAVRPVRPNGHGTAWETLLGHEELIGAWVSGSVHDGVRRDPLSIVKIEELLARQGVRVPYRTLHRFAVERCGFRTGRGTTVRIADGEPGVECQVDFAQMGLLFDPETGRRRKVHALIFTAVLSRHMFVWLSYSQTLTTVIAGCEAAWVFFGGVFKVLIPDNLTPVVTKADAVNPRLSAGWLDYAQHVGFGTDPARVRSPQDKPRVERVVQYVRGNFWAGESFADLADAQARVEVWCAERAGMRIHGTTQRRPVEMFTELEAACLLPVPVAYDQPIFTRVKVHRDFHVEVAKALYSVPEQHIGRHLDARADSELVKLYSTGGPAGAGGGRLVKTHPRQPPGGRSTDPADLPEHKAGYATRDLTRLVAVCAGHGPSIGIYAERLLDDPLPWTRMRSVYRLQGLVTRYGPEPVETACGRALDLDVVSVSKIAAMLAKATETQQPQLPAAAGAGHDTGGGRFARDPDEYARSHSTGTTPSTTRTTPTSVQLTLIPGGDMNCTEEGQP